VNDLFFILLNNRKQPSLQNSRSDGILLAYFCTVSLSPVITGKAGNDATVKNFAEAGVFSAKNRRKPAI